ncbi:MAG: hypothetical protein AAFO93_05810 [Pseudomonadota bacterium]
MFKRFLILATLIMTAETASADLPSPVAGKLRVYSEVELSPKQERELVRFSRRSMYYGAFYFAPGTDASGWEAQTHALAAADALAKAACSADAGVACTLYADMVPENEAASGRNLSSLSREGRNGIKEAQREHRNGLHGAFAISPLGIWASGWNYQTKSSAERNVMQLCNRKAVNKKSTIDDETLAVLKSANLIDCRIYTNFR